MTSVHSSSLSTFLLALACLAGDACAQNVPAQIRQQAQQQAGAVTHKHRQVTRGPVAPDMITYQTQSPGEQRGNRNH